MGWFRCLVRGERFPGALIGEPGAVGFYVTRFVFVESDDPDEAEAAVLRSLRDEPALRLPSDPSPPIEADAPSRARVFFEEVEPVDTRDVPDVAPGFAFFPEDDG